jgi:LCP family protein required for cell wall assembly
MTEKSTPFLSDKDVFNVLLIGSDSRKVGGSGRSDATIIVSLNKRTKTITTTSLLRDIYLQIPGRSNNRINSAYAYGGADLLMETIEQNFKIQIDRYASIDFFAFMDVIDAIGGISIEVTSEEIPVINNYVKELNWLSGEEDKKDCLSEAGSLILNGKQALGYVRNRYIGNNDFDRTVRQRNVLEQMYIKVMDLGLLQLNDLMNTILPQITSNLTEGELLSLILSLPSYIDYDLEQWRIPIDGSYSMMNIQGMSVIGIDFQKNIDVIHNRIYSEKGE